MASVEDVIRPYGDKRVSHNYAELNGLKYHYLLGVPPNREFTQTVFLIHGWPDISMGWRYQIPMIVEKGYRVIAPDLIGFGGTDAPRGHLASLGLYGYKRASDDVAELARQLGCNKIILGGHDWGGVVVHRTCLWYPELVSHAFFICAPIFSPRQYYIPLETLVEGPTPQLAYQLQFSGPDVERAAKTPEDIRGILNAMYGALAEGRRVFDPREGIDLSKLLLVGKAPLLTKEVLDYYVEEFSRNGVHGGLNWYRTREVNYREELALEKKSLDMPCLYVLGTRDPVVTKNVASGIKELASRLTFEEIDASHFALVEKPQGSISHLGDGLISLIHGQMTM